MGYDLVDKLESRGKFVEAEKVRRGEITEAKKKIKKVEVDGETISGTIMSRIKEDIDELLTSSDLSTAIFYINKNIESALQSLQQGLSSSIQEVLDSGNTENNGKK